MYVNGVSNCRGVGVGIILISPEGIRVEKSFRLIFLTSNNEAKFEAFLTGLKISRQVGADRVQLHYDSRLVVS